MKILCCGDRNWANLTVIKKVLSNYDNTTTIISGGARGADTLSELAAIDLGMNLIVMYAQWDIYGKAAGPIRNRKMLAQEPNLVIAFHSNISESKGTADMIRIAKKAGIPVTLITE